MTEIKPKVILTTMLHSLVSDKDGLVVSEQEFSDHLIFSIRVAGRDYGRVLGGQAKHLSAFKTLMDAIGSKNERIVTVNLEAALSDEKFPRQPFRFNPGWGKEQLMPIVKVVVENLFDYGAAVQCVEVGQTLALKVDYSKREVFERKVKGGNRESIDDDQIRDAFEILFEAIASSNGRELNVVFERVFYGHIANRGADQ